MLVRTALLVTKENKMTTVVTKDYETGTSGAVTVKVGSDTYGKEGGSGRLGW